MPGERLEQPLQLRHASHSFQAHQVGLTRDDELAFGFGFGYLKRLLGHLDGIQHHRVHALPGFPKLPDQAIANDVQFAAAELPGKVISRPSELIFSEIAVNVQDLVLNVAIIENQDGQNPLVGERQEFDLPERGLRGPGNRHHTREPGHGRQQVGCRQNQRLRVGIPQRVLEQLHLGVPRRAQLHQRIHKEPVALDGGHAAGGGVRRGNEAHVFKVRHDVADGRRADLKARLARQRAGADRMTLANIAVDQHPQQMPGPLVRNFHELPRPHGTNPRLNGWTRSKTS